MGVKSSEGRWRLLDWEGLRVRTRDDAGTALTLARLFSDPEADAAVRLDVAVRLLFLDPDAVTEKVSDLGGLVLEALRTCAGLTTGTEAADTPVLDWEADRQYIEASVRATYGTGLEELAATVDLPTLCHLVALCPHETPIGQALHYRTAKPPRPTKHNQRELEEFRRRQKFWRLKPKENPRGTGARERYATMSSESTSAFRALAKQANHRR